MTAPTLRRPSGPAAAIAAAMVAAVCAGPAAAQDAAAGRAKAAACTVCHGASGLSNQPDVPHLAAQPAIYVERQLRAYRSGERKHEVMAVMARPLSDDDIRNLAAWFASIKLEATPP